MSALLNPDATGAPERAAWPVDRAPLVEGDAAVRVVMIASSLPPGALCLPLAPE